MNKEEKLKEFVREFEEISYNFRIKSREQAVWKLFDKYRGFIDFKNLFPQFASLKNSIYLQGITPKLIIELVSNFISKSGSKSKTLYDPFCGGIPNLFLSLTEEYNLNGKCNVNRTETKKIVYILNKNQEIHLKSIEEVLKFRSKDKFDLIVSAPPFGMKAGRIGVDVPNFLKPLKNRDLGALIFLNSLKFLDNNGNAVFITSNSLFFSSTIDLNEILKKLNVHIQGIISLTGQPYRPLTGIPVNVIFFNREKPQKIFIGALDKLEQIDNLVANFLEKREAEIPNFGRLINSIEDFNGWESFEANFRIKNLVSSNRLKEFKINTHFKDIKKIKEGNYKKGIRSIFLPQFTSMAVSSKPLDKKMNGYYQMILKKDSPLNEDFLAVFLSEIIGVLQRKMYAKGSIMKYLTKADLKEGYFYLPPLEKQQELLELFSKLNVISSEILEFKEKIFNYLSSTAIQETKEFVDYFESRDSIDNWMENLPFSLASILQLAISFNDKKDKVETYIHFLEAFAEFLLNLYLSAFKSKNEYYESILDKKIRIEGKKLLMQSTFGTWTTFGSKLSKFIRTQISSQKEEDKDLVLSIFKTNLHNIEIISHKEIFKILDNAKDIRNKISHSGQLNEKFYGKTLQNLENLINKLRSIVGNTFKYYKLLRRPAKARSTDLRTGGHEYEVEKLIGPNNIFKKTTIKVSQQMLSDELYMYDNNEKSLLRLLPFIILEESLKNGKGVSYFYNSLIDKEKVRYVSYHSSDKPEVEKKNIEIVNLIEEIS